MRATIRRKATRRRGGWRAAIVAWMAASTPLAAAVLIPPENLGDLARQSELVVMAVAGEATSEWVHGALVTVTPFVVTEVVSGYAAPGHVLEVEVPGGSDGSGTMLVIPGSPRFAAGSTYLLPLRPAHDGRWQPTMLAYGILEHHEGEDGAQLHPLPEAAEITTLARPDGRPVERVGVYRERALLEHLATVASGARAWEAAAVAVPAGAGTALAAPPAGCAFLAASNGKPMRWKLFDSGKTVAVAATRGGDPGTAGGGLVQLQQALAAWSAVPATAIRLAYQGEKDYRLSCGSGFDAPGAGTNMVVFGDPCKDLPDLSGCTGIVGYGGAWASGTHTFDGVTYNTITSLYVVVNNGISCLSAELLQAVLTHELGHGLGFDHTSDPTSVMYRYCGNAINDTDAGCAQYLYSAIGAKAPAAPTGVTASDGTFSDLVQVRWNAVAGAAAYRVVRRPADDGAETSQFGPVSATQWDDTTALPGRRYLYAVQAVNPFGASPASAVDEGYRGGAVETVTLVAPTTVGSGIAYTLSWTPVGGVDAWELEEATDPDFAAPTVATVAGTSLALVHSVTTQKTFYYRVRPLRGRSDTQALAAASSNVATTTVVPATASSTRIAPRLSSTPS